MYGEERTNIVTRGPFQLKNRFYVKTPCSTQESDEHKCCLGPRSPPFLPSSVVKEVSETPSTVEGGLRLELLLSSDLIRGKYQWEVGKRRDVTWISDWRSLV